MVQPRRSRWVAWTALVVAISGGVAAPASATSYDMIDLGPDGGVAYGVDHGNVAGASFQAGVVIWSNNGATATPLTLPPGLQGITPRSIWGDQVAGSWVAPDHNTYALLWNGPNNLVYLSSRTTGGGIGYALATDGAQQVGAVSGPIGGDAALWSGTADSFVSLNPSGYDQSYAEGVWGGMQVGYGNPHGGPIGALVWQGSANSFTVLGTQAEALGISRGQIVGFSDKLPRSGSFRDAVIWTNATAASFTDVAPANTTASKLLSTNGTQQVGDYSTGSSVLGQLPLDHHAAVWTGTAATFQPLPMPTGDNWSMAYGIDGDGNIAGVAAIENNGNPGNTVPLMWVPHRLPGDANFDGIVNFSDLLILAQHYGQTGEWVDGEFSGGGTVNFADLLTLAQHYGQSQATLQYSLVVSPDVQQGQVPEPACLTLLASAVLMYRRRRIRQV